MYNAPERCGTKRNLNGVPIIRCDAGSHSRCDRSDEKPHGPPTPALRAAVVSGSLPAARSDDPSNNAGMLAPAFGPLVVASEPSVFMLAL